MVNSYEDVLGWIGDETTRLFDIAIENAPVSGAVFVEVGTYRGKSSICLYDKIQESGKDITLYTVDDWAGTEPHDQLDDNNRDIFIENRGTRSINLIDDDSIFASDLFESQSIDFLFIDSNNQWGNLSYEINSWMPKMKDGSIISGHDYHWTGVGMVVNSLFPNASIISESISHAPEFPDLQPEEWRHHAWYSFISEETTSGLNF